MTLIAIMGWAAAAGALTLTVRLMRAAAARREAVVRAAHELRGPLTAVGLAVELEARRGALGADTRRAVEHELARAALALEDLSAARSTSTARFEHIDASELVAASVAAARAGAAAAGVELRSSWSGATGACVRGERWRLAQALANLIANAVEHGGGEVSVRGRAEAGLVRIEVSDSGPGLCAPIATLTRRARRGRGARGRGLAIAGAVAERHGGRLASAPSPRGARLVLELPLAASGHGAAEAS